MANCEATLWDAQSQLYADPLAQKGLTADTCAAYGLLGFMGAMTSTGNPLKLVLTGEFPKATYMSLQIYRGRPFQTSERVGPALTDYEIQAKTGNNRFATLNPNDVGTFEIEITPDASCGPNCAPNRIWYEPENQPGDSAVITAFYRIYLPETQITMADLPKIEAFDFVTGNPTDCPQATTMDWYLDRPVLEFAVNSFTPELNPIPFFNLNQIAGGNPSGLGSNDDLKYKFSFSKVPHGKIAVVKFRAPAVDFAAPNVQGSTVRYWSICSVYEPKLKTLNALCCDPQNPGERDVTVVFGPDDQQIRSKAAFLGADFLPDTRSQSEEVLSFILRNLLPHKDFKAFEGQYEPTARVFTRSQFLSLQV